MSDTPTVGGLSKSPLPSAPYGATTSGALTGAMLLGASTAALTLRIYGLPGPMGSKRHLGRGVMVESSKKVKPWRSDVMTAVVGSYQGPLIEAPVSLEVVFLFPRPKGHYGKRGLRASAPLHLISQGAGDIDKLCRSTLDGISAGAGGALLRDDSQVVNLSACKRYCAPGECPGALLTVIVLAEHP